MLPLPQIRSCPEPLDTRRHTALPPANSLFIPVSFTHRVAFEEVSGHRVLLNCGPGNQGRSTWGTSHGACLEFPREAGLILRGAGKAGNPFQTT